MASRFVVIDFETHSLRDLRKVGAHRCAADPSTDVWCVAYAIDDQPVQIWLRGEPVPPAILEAAADPEVLFVAHNAGFERAILQHILGPRYGWPAIPVERWRCTMAMALTLALPAALGKVADVLGLDHRKHADQIMHLLARPRSPRVGEDPKGLFWFDETEPLPGQSVTHLEKLYAYCKADVECEHELFQRLPPLLPAEQELWQLDQIINDRGFYTDGGLIEKAIAIAEAAGKAVQAELQQITGGEITSTSQVAKLLAWLAAHGCELVDLQKPTLANALRRKGLAPEARRAIELRAEAAHASADKMKSLQVWRGRDGRVCGAFRFHGAATGRWSGSGPLPQNFRKENENTADKFAAVMSGDIETVRALGAPIEIVGDIARAAICAPPGSRLMTGDFSGIESRVLAWIAGQHDKVAQWAKFDQTQDRNDHPYLTLGRQLGFPEDLAYARGKIADLAFGYQGGLGAYKNFAPDDDTATDEQIEGFKQAWRGRHPQIVQFWWGIDRAAVAAVQRPGATISYGRLTLQSERRDGGVFLFITLPSGRRLAYPFARIITNRFDRFAVEFQDNAIIGGGWSPCNHGMGAYGGVWVANVVSGIARDLLAAAMTRLEAAGYPVVLHVHDEIAVELPDGAGDLAEFERLMAGPPT
jgi:DNA polymerase